MPWTRPSGDWAPSGRPSARVAKGRAQSGPRVRAHVHLEAVEGVAVGGGALDGFEALLGGDLGRDVEVAEAGDGGGGALYTLGVGDLAAEHLVAGAEAEDAAAAAEVGGDVDVEAGVAQGAEVGDGGLRAGEEDEVGVAGEGGAGPDAEELDLGVGGEGVEVVEVGDAGEDGDGDADGAAGRGRRGRGRGRPRRGGGGRARRRGRGRSGASRCMAAMVAMPSAKRVGSPRKRLTMKAFIRAASAGSRTACVPTRLAMTPPRSMSPMRTTGVSVARAKPMLAMSLARRLVSEALPAPSTRTRSASAERVAKLLRTWGKRVGLRAW